MSVNQRDRVKSIAIIGLGPRGTSVLERITENARRDTEGSVEVHVFDATIPGAGAVWDPTQSPLLLMNTVTSQVSLFTDGSVECEGPIVRGPSMYSWITQGLADEVVSPYAELSQEIARLGADDYPSRALYGVYLQWVFERIRAKVPQHLSLHIHATRVEQMDPQGQSWTLRDSMGMSITVDQVVLALGHLPARVRGREYEFESFARDHGLVYLPPANPADVDTNAIPAGETVIVRGLGLCFFDYLGLLTTGRGGVFEQVNGDLVYHASGGEPIIHAGCRRGVPHHSRGQNQKGVSERHVPRFLTPEEISSLQGQARREGGLDFMRHIWPHASNEVEFAHVAALLTERNGPLPETTAGAIVEALRCLPREKNLRLDYLGVSADDIWDWQRLLHPCRGKTITDSGLFATWLTSHLRSDVASAMGGNVHNPLKAALDVLRDLRNEVRQVLDHGAVSAQSYRDHVTGWYTPMNAFLSIGPPVERIKELIALINAGIVSIAGPDFTVETTSTGAFTGYSPLVSDSRRDAHVLIDARLPDARAWNTTDPLVQHLLTQGIAREHTLVQPHMSHKTGSLDVTGRPYRIIGSDGQPYENVYAFGIPTEGIHWATAAGVRPGVGSVILTDADAIARAALDLPHATSDSSDELNAMRNEAFDDFATRSQTRLVGNASEIPMFGTGPAYAMKSSVPVEQGL